MWHKLILIGYFVVQDVSYDNGTYNVLLLQKGSVPNLVATHTKSMDDYTEGMVLYLEVHGDCSKTYEVLEGNGKRGTPWRAEDDWYLNSEPYICNSELITRH